MKRILFILAIAVLSNHSYGQYRCQELKTYYPVTDHSQASNSRSDTIDILHYHLDLNLSDISNRNLSGRAEILFRPLISNISEIKLDLLQLQTDSVKMNNSPLVFSHLGELLKINLGAAYQNSDTLEIQVFYSGKPKVDNSGWGGFHTQAGYFFNLGVGFAADPHVYGRAWFPCFDNFVEHSTYSFRIETLSSHKAYCNGLRTADSIMNNGLRVALWDMDDPIPSYLASVAVSNYTDTLYNLQARQQNIPVQLIARPGDMSNVLSAFTHLDSNISGFISHFGPYRWQKVGYAMTPVGAMEHASSIHFPISLINQGQSAAEDIMAHELAHHWWGNLVTCRTADDMWINEGMAEFCSHLFYEDIYGRQRYIDEVRANAYNVINNAHRQDGAYYSVYALPHNLVYGFHVYQKGAMVAHNLRARLGDSLFFNGLTQLLNNNAFDNLATLEFRDQLSQITGVSLQDFFQGWIYGEGFPSVAVDSMYVSGNNAFVRLRQRLHHAPQLYQDLPVEISFFSNNGDTVNRQILLNGASGDYNFTTLPFSPSFALASYSGKLLTADTYDEFLLRQPKIYTDKYGKMRLELKAITDSCRLISMHHYAGPGGKVPGNSDFRISSSRYWTVKGINLGTADITAVIKYDGTVNGYDQDLLEISEDSIMVLYRADASAEWTPWPNQKKFGSGGVFNKLGTIEIYQLSPGEYVLANSAISLELPDKKEAPGGIKVYPNPARNELHLQINNLQQQDLLIELTDASGKLCYSQTLPAPVNPQKLSIPLPLTGGFVWVRLNEFIQKIIIQP